jgi:hypothetical protein
MSLCRKRCSRCASTLLFCSDLYFVTMLCYHVCTFFVSWFDSYRDRNSLAPSRIWKGISRYIRYLPQRSPALERRICTIISLSSNTRRKRMSAWAPCRHPQNRYILCLRPVRSSVAQVVSQNKVICVPSRIPSDPNLGIVVASGLEQDVTLARKEFPSLSAWCVESCHLACLGTMHALQWNAASACHTACSG